MLHKVSNLFGRPAPHKHPPVSRETAAAAHSPAQKAGEPRKQSYSKIFRWKLPDDQKLEPVTVEVVGTFTQWQRVPLLRDGKSDGWHVTLHHIEGHKTHHYMLLVNGKPAPDKNCDGYAIPHGAQEQEFSITTPRGPRLFMLFAQTK